MTENQKALAKEVKILRAMNELNQQELADKSGVAMCVISFIENGRRRPRADTLVRLARALNVEEEKLLQYLD